MAENLNVGTRIDGANEQTDNSTMEKYCYDDLESNCNVYGGLYQWNEMMQYITTPGVKGICPTGWHMPTDDEWTILTTFLGGESVACGKMKETGLTHWASPNTGATNSSGFTVLPGGGRSGGVFFYTVSYNALFWSSSPYDALNSWGRRLTHNSEGILHQFNYKADGFSVRCVKN